MTINERSLPPAIRVLVVEDDDALRHSFARSLGVGFAVELAATVAQALALLEAPMAFEVVVSDLDLRDTRGRDGLWVLDEARVIQPWACRVLYTGSAPVDFAARISPGLLHACLHKPVPSARFRSLLRDLAAGGDGA
jgi:DNA-binding NtrC family response regulator